MDRGEPGYYNGIVIESFTEGRRAIRFLLIALGAALGANARYLVGLWAEQRAGAGFPLGTLLVNVSGSLLIGLFLGLLERRLALPQEARFFFVVGFLGAYTTFSSFAWETVSFFREDLAWVGVANIFLNSVGSLGAALLGLWLALLGSR